MSEIARTGYALLGRQTVMGTPVVPPPANGIRLTDSTLSGQADRMDDDPEIGGGRDYDTGGALMGGYVAKGELSGILRPRVFGLLLMAAGFTPAAPVQDATTGAYTHTLTPGATFTPLTIETRFGNTAAVRRFADCLVDELTISLDAGGKPTFSASIVGRSEAWQGSPQVPTFESEPVGSWDGSAITFDGLGTYRFESMEWKVANNLSDDEWVIGSRLLDDVTPASREVTFGGTIKVGSNSPSVTDLYRAAVYGSKTATAPGGSDPYHTSATATFGSTRLINTSTLKRYAAIVTVPDLVLAGFPLEASGEDRLTVDVEGKAYKGAGNVCSIDLQNTLATAISAL